MNRASKIIAAIVLTPVVLVLGWYAVSGVTGTIEVAKAKRQAVTDVATALPASDAQAQRQQERLRAGVREGAVAYSWRELDCDITSNDAGWIVQDYVQECEVRTVDLFPVPDARPGSCQYVPVPPAVDPAYRSHLTRGRTESITAPLQSQTFCPDGLTAPPRLGVSRVLAGSRPQDLSLSPAWLVAESRTPVSRTTLGCNPWGVLLCTQPVHRPLLEARN
jgi:hypothetical protein